MNLESYDLHVHSCTKQINISALFRKIDELYKILKKSSKEELEAVALQTKEKIIPPMNRMLDRESQAGAIEKYNKRKEMITVDVPANGTVSEGYHFKYLDLKLLCRQPIFIIGSGQFRG